VFCVLYRFQKKTNVVFCFPLRMFNLGPWNRSSVIWTMCFLCFSGLLGPRLDGFPVSGFSILRTTIAWDVLQIVVPPQLEAISHPVVPAGTSLCLEG
jgi:hypothetical protein